MAKQAKGITVELDGNLTNLTQDMKAAEKTGNSLGKELQQVNRLLKLDPGNVVMVKQKQDLLAQSITTTKGKLKEMEAAQAQVEEQFKNGDIDGGQYRNFQRELEKTKQNLAALEKEQKSVTGLSGAFNQVKIKLGEVKEKLEPVLNGMKKVGQVTVAAVDVGKKALVAYSTAALGVGTAVAGMTAKAALWSDDLNTLSAQTGLSTDELQRFQYATDLIDVPMETLTGSMAKLTKNMGTAQKGTGDAANAFKELGIDITDSTGELRSNQDVFDEAITALGEMENETQRDAYAMQIFGKSAQDLNPLIKGGADALKELGDSAAASGLILSQEGVDHLNEYNDSLDIMKANATSASRVLAGDFSAGFKAVTDTIGAEIPAITSAVHELFSGGDTGAAQQSLTESFSNIVTDALTTLGDYLPVFLTALNAVVLSIVSSLSATLPDFIATVLPALIAGLVGLVEGLLAQVPTVVPLLLEAGIALITGILDGFNTIIPQVVAIMPDLISRLVAVLVANIPVIIQGGVQLLLGLIRGIVQSIPALVTAVTELIPVIVSSLLGALPDIITAGMEILLALALGIVDAIPQIVQTVTDLIPLIVETVLANLPALLDGGMQIIMGLAMGIVQNIPQIVTTVVNMIPVIVNAITSNLPQIIQAGIQILVAVIGGIVKAIPQLVSAIPQVITAIVNAIKSGLTSILDVGKNIVEGLWQGISNSISWLTDKIREWCGGVLDSIKSFFGINSPSTVMAAEVGRWMGEGIGVGFVSSMRKVRRDMAQAIPANFDTELNVRTRGGGLPGVQDQIGAGGAVFNQTNHYHSPKALSAAEAARKTRNDTRQLILQGVKA